MPTYEYRCEGCGHAFELFQSIKADPAKSCPKCGEDKARRVIGAGGGFIFKGSGFYITDYTRSKDYKEKAKSEGASAPSPSPGAAAPSSTGTSTGAGSGSGTTGGGATSGGSGASSKTAAA